MKYSVGDKVRYTGGSTSCMTNGKNYEIRVVDEYDDNLPIQVIDDQGGYEWLYATEFNVVNDDELTELRAWKETALARFPALAERETDDEAAERIESEHYNSYRDISETIKTAFAWARANNA